MNYIFDRRAPTDRSGVTKICRSCVDELQPMIKVLCVKISQSVQYFTRFVILKT